MKLNKKILTLFLALILLLVIPISFANEDIGLNESQEISISDNPEILQEKYDTVYVDASYSGQDSGNTVKNISEGLNRVNDGGTIYLNGDLSGQGNTNITLDSQPNNINFIGIDAKIDGQSANSFMVIKSGKYSFKDISFVNNYKNDQEAYGGVIENINGRLTITNCLFEDNVLIGVNRANGGAIDNSNGYVTIENCTFINNSVSVTNSSGNRKNAADGGAISNLGDLYIYNTNFTSNKALRNGGAIRTQDGGHARINNCSFTNNIAAYHLSGGSFGGAIYSWDCPLDVSYCIFKNNKVIDSSGYGAQGGAISSDRGAGKINILYSQFINNTAEGKSIISGQSIYFGSSDANVNYCYIDTSIYSASSSTNFDYNLWDDNNINNLIENIPTSARVKIYAALEIYSNIEKLEEGLTIPIFVDLFWNGTSNQNNINLIPSQKIILTSNCGNLTDEIGTLINGHFETKLTLNDITDPIVTAKIDKIVSNIDFSPIIDNNNITISFKVLPDETVIITISSKKYMDGICLVDIDDDKYYTELENGKNTLNIHNLSIGTHYVLVHYMGGDNENIHRKLIIPEKINSNMEVSINNGLNPTVNIKLPKDATGNLTVKLDGNEITTVDAQTTSIKLNQFTVGAHAIEVTYSGDSTYSRLSKVIPVMIKQDTLVNVKSKITLNAIDISAKEKAGSFTFKLTDTNGNVLTNKKVQVALNGKIYQITTNKLGIGSVKVNINKADTYTCAISFKGDENYNACPLTMTKLTVNKKKTTIKATAKKFKVKSKTKKVSVTLKTVKNQFNKKTYLYKGKKLTLKVNGKTYKAKTNKKGVAKFSLKLNKKGKYTAKIKFAGDKTYKSSIKTIKITVK